MYTCEIQEKAAQPTLSIRFRAAVQDLAQAFGRVYGAIGAYLEAKGEQPAGGVYATYYNMDMQNLDIEAGFTVTRPVPGKGEIQPGEIPAGTYAICHYTGDYSAIAPAYDDLTRFVQENGFMPSGVAYEWYLNDPEDPNLRETDVSFPVAKKAEAHPV